jgi:phosphoribosylanthranilate isomerase
VIPLIKICGITRPEDARLAAELGAAAVGMVLWPGSPRFVDRTRAREIAAALPPGVGAVGVFVNQTEEAIALAPEIGLTAIQLHGDESAASYQQAGIAVIKAVPVRDESAGRAASQVPSTATVLLDAHDPVKRGGTGRVMPQILISGITASP